jgi:ribosomal protein S18 acetylase RimI-like enzyme
MALFDIYLTPSDWRKGEISWLSGAERERAEALINPLWDAREKLWSNERYIYGHVIAVHPDHQRKGVGEKLIRWGMDVAKQCMLPIYIESSKEARRLYEKVGCRRMKETPVHKDENGEDQEIALYVWLPEGGESALPKAVELA